MDMYVHEQNLSNFVELSFSTLTLSVVYACAYGEQRLKYKYFSHLPPYSLKRGFFLILYLAILSRLSDHKFLRIHLFLNPRIEMEGHVMPPRFYVGYGIRTYVLWFVQKDFYPWSPSLAQVL